MSSNLIRKIGAMILCLLIAACSLCVSGCGDSGVNTYAVSDMYMDSDMNVSESYGEVKTYNMQNVYVSDSMNVLDVHVVEGQNVKKGDKLITFDTALTQIQLEKKQLEVKSLELALEQAKQELRTVNSYKPMVVTTIVPPVSSDKGTQVTGYEQIDGEGTFRDPYIFVVEDGMIPCSAEFLEELCPPGTESVYAVFQGRSQNMTKGTIEEYCGLCYSNSDTGIAMKLFDASEFCQNPPTDPYEEIEYNSGLTAAEISALRAAAKEQLTEAEFAYRLSNIEYQQMLLEVDNGVVTAELDGTIVTLNDAEMAKETGEPVVKLSANGGYIVEGTLSELELGTVSEGQIVQITSWENYGEYEAEIAEISTIPTVQNGWTSGNSNVSYYPFTAYIDGSANLKENEYISIRYNSRGEPGESFYIEQAFVLNEDGRYYAYVQGEDGLLEKRELTTGGTMWNMYICILDGLTREDRIAFPYGKNVKEGAKTREADMSELYSY